MKKQILSLIFVIIASIGFSQLPTLTKTSDLTPITINNNDTLLVPVGDSVWINGVETWNTNTLGDAGNFYLIKTDLITWAATFIDTIVIGTTNNNDKYRFKISVSTKYRYAIKRQLQSTPDLFFYIRGTTGMTTGIASHDFKKSNIKVYPNPVSDNMTVSFEAFTHDQKISIFDIQGSLVAENTDEREIGTNVIKFDVMSLNAGIYFVRTGTDTFKIMKQ